MSQARQAVEAFFQGIGAEEIAINPAIGLQALDASAWCGKSVGHAADLNFGDCFAYACAKFLDVRLLYKGSDFEQTDLAL